MMRRWLSPNLINATFNSRAALLMLLSCVIFSLMTAVVRHISQELPTLEVIFFRNLFGLLTIAPLFVRAGLVTHLRTSRIRLYLLRGGMGYVSMLCWFTAIAVVPLADAVALGFTAPFFVTILSILVLGEVVRRRRWSAMLIGFAGAMVILRPGFGDFNGYYLLVVASAGSMACSVIMIKLLGRTDSATTIVAYMVIIILPISAVPAIFVWQPPTVEQLLWLLALGGLATAGHLSVTKALMLADATAIMPLDFTRLPITALIAFWAFAEVPDPWVWVGAAIIFGSSVYIAQREAALKIDPEERPAAAVIEARE